MLKATLACFDNVLLASSEVTMAIYKVLVPIPRGFALGIILSLIFWIPVIWMMLHTCGQTLMMLGSRDSVLPNCSKIVTELCLTFSLGSAMWLMDHDG
jgi:hypothetical protein